MFKLHDEALGANSTRLLYFSKVDKKIEDLERLKADKLELQHLEDSVKKTYQTIENFDKFYSNFIDS